jgi:hypothetical protein
MGFMGLQTGTESIPSRLRDLESVNACVADDKDGGSEHDCGDGELKGLHGESGLDSGSKGIFKLTQLCKA